MIAFFVGKLHLCVVNLGKDYGGFRGEATVDDAVQGVAEHEFGQGKERG